MQEFCPEGSLRDAIDRGAFLDAENLPKMVRPYSYMSVSHLCPGTLLPHTSIQSHITVQISGSIYALSDCALC